MAVAIDPVAATPPGPDRGWRAKGISSGLPELDPWPGTQLRGGPTLGAAAEPERRSSSASRQPPVAKRASSAAGAAAASLDLTQWAVGSSVVVSVSGEIDIATAGQLSGGLGAALDGRPGGLICDLSGVGFLAAAGLSVLLVARRRAIARRAAFALVCPQPGPRRVIGLVGLDAVFALHDDVASAAAAQGGGGSPGPTARRR